MCICLSGSFSGISILFSTSHTNKMACHLFCGKGQPTAVKCLLCLQRDHKCTVEDLNNSFS